jgi:hypothetical protein
VFSERGRRYERERERKREKDKEQLVSGQDPITERQKFKSTQKL